jgi:hypothetical protein
MPLLGREKVDQMIDDKYEDLNNKVRGVFFQGGAAIIIQTPVDTGRTRANWHFDVGSPTSQTTNSKDSFKGLRDLNKMPSFIFNKKMFITNNLPNIIPLEFGGYPNPVKLGTWNKKKGQYEKRSEGGFSKQAPGGWVRATLIKMRNGIRKL